MDITATLGALLNNMQVDRGDGTMLTIPYQEWGQHYGDSPPLTTIQTPQHDHKPGNIGGGVDLEIQEAQIHAIWANRDDITSIDTFAKNFVAEIKRIVRANARTLSPAWWVQIGNVVNLDDMVNPDGEGPGVMQYERAIIIHAHATETYTMN